jgi:hypothetical protein
MTLIDVDHLPDIDELAEQLVSEVHLPDVGELSEPQAPELDLLSTAGVLGHHPPPRLCACGCERPVEARPGPGRPSVYATAECRRGVEYRARKAVRPAGGRTAHNDPRAPRETIHVRIADPVKLARGWFRWRYPADYKPSGDGRSPSGFRTLLSAGHYPAGVVQRTDRFAVRVIRGADVEIAELSTWIRGLPGYQQADFASRAIESIGAGRVMQSAPHASVRFRDDPDGYRPDPVTLGQLKGFYRQDECSLPGCHREPHGDGLCRRHYDQRRNGALAR